MAYIQFATADGRNVDWYDMTTGAVVASGFNTFSPEDNAHTYSVTQDGVSETFVVFDYNAYRLYLDSLTATLNCVKRFFCRRHPHRACLLFRGELPHLTRWLSFPSMFRRP